MTIKNWLACVLVVIVTASYGQSITSPYSSFGLGEILPVSYAHNEAMGGVGVGLPSVYFVNNKNAAWLPYNLYTSFQVGLKSDVRNYSGETGDITDQTGSIEYISFFVPIKSSKWGMHFGLSPYSSVNYEVASQVEIEGSENLALSEFSGSGGLTQLTWSNGFKLFKGVNVGVSAAYVFGKLDRSIENVIIDQDSAFVSTFRTRYFEEKNYSDITFAISLAHRLEINETSVFNYGGNYQLGGTLQGREDVFLERKSSNGSLLQSNPITEDETFNTDIPSQIEFGFSYEKLNKYAVGIDFGYGLWKDVQGLDVETQNALSINAGASFTPDFKSVNSYFDRVMYKGGLSYRQLPYIVNGTEINDFGVTFGASFPVSGLSSLDTSFKFGTRGTTESSLIQETYFQFIFGLTINDRWFIKRRYD